jgi:hypothetical protein
MMLVTDRMREREGEEEGNDDDDDDDDNSSWASIMQGKVMLGHH